MSANAIPWWGILLHAPLDQGRAELIDLVREEYEDDEYMIVPGDGWVGWFSVRGRDGIRWNLVDKLEARGREIIVLDHGDEAGVFRWVDGEMIHEERNPDEVEEEHGITVPSPPSTTRPSREAALIVGRPLDEIRAELPGVELRTTSRGVVALGPTAGRLRFPDRPGVKVYRVSHYLDDGEFVVDVLSMDDAGTFAVPDTHADLADVDGETDPRKIVRALDIPENFMFP